MFVLTAVAIAGISKAFNNAVVYRKTSQAKAIRLHNEIQFHRIDVDMKELFGN